MFLIRVRLIHLWLWETPCSNVLSEADPECKKGDVTIILFPNLLTLIAYVVHAQSDYGKETGLFINND